SKHTAEPTLSVRSLQSTVGSLQTLRIHPIQNPRNSGEAVPRGVDLLSTYFESEAASRHRILGDSPRHSEHGSVPIPRIEADSQQFAPPQSRSRSEERRVGKETRCR